MEKKNNKKIIHSITSVVLCLILIPIIIINIVIIVNGFTNDDDMPGVFGYRPAIVLSGSMEPTFDAGDVVFIKDVENPAALQKDDIICYLVSGKATTHRIIQVAEKEGETAYITKGDYNNVEDRLAVMPDQIQGIYTGVRIAHLGDILMFMQSTQGILLCLGVPFGLYICYDIFKRRKDSNKKTAQLEAELAKLKAQESRSEESEASTQD